MTMPKFIRIWLLKRELARGYARQRIAREARRNAALRGMGRA